MSKYDKRDPDPQVVKLTRAGHYLWFQVKNAKLVPTHRQQQALYEALEIIWTTKAALKVELAERRRAAFALRNPFKREEVLA